MRTLHIDAGASDEQLWRDARRGDRDAFGEIVRRYQSLICSLAYSRTGNLASSQDLAQDTFVAAWHHLAELREPARLRAWLCGIVRHLAANAARVERRRGGPADALEAIAEPHAPTRDPEAQAVTRQEEALLWQALGDMPDTFREPLVLFYREERSIADVAALLDLSEAAVKQRLSRGRALLRREMASLVESALTRSRPTATFTTAVLGAIALASPAPALAAALGGAAAAAAATGATGGTAVSAMSVATAAATTTAATTAAGALGTGAAVGGAASAATGSGATAAAASAMTATTTAATTTATAALGTGAAVGGTASAATGGTAAATVGSAAATAHHVASVGGTTSAAGVAGAAKGLGATAAAAVAGPALGLSIAWIATRALGLTARSADERAAIDRHARRALWFCLAAAALLLVVLYAGRDALRTSPGFVIGVASLWTAGVLAFLLDTSYRLQRQIVHIRQSTGTEDAAYARLLAARGLRLAGGRSIVSRRRWLGLPLFAYGSTGMDAGAPASRAVRAWIAIGDLAVSPFFAAGGVAVAPIAIGGVTVGLISLSVGGIGVGLLAVGSLAFGWWAFGFAAVGWKAAAGAAAVAHDYAIGALVRAGEANTPAALAWFRGRWFSTLVTLWAFALPVIVLLAIVVPLGLLLRRAWQLRAMRTSEPDARAAADDAPMSDGQPMSMSMTTSMSRASTLQTSPASQTAQTSQTAPGTPSVAQPPTSMPQSRSTSETGTGIQTETQTGTETARPREAERARQAETATGTETEAQADTEAQAHAHADAAAAKCIHAAPSERLHGLDALRAAALLLGIVLHSTMAYVLPPGLWAVGTTAPQPLLGWLAFYIHSFRLGLFFLLAGFFGALVVGRRGVRAYLRDRVIRILLVFIVALYPMKFLLVALWIAGGRATGWLQLPPTVSGLPWYVLSLGSFGEERWPDIPLTHLWFLYALFCITALFLTARAAAGRLFTRAGQFDGASRLLRTLVVSRAWPLVCAAACTPLLAMMQGMDIDTPDRSLAWNLPVMALYGLWFAFGWWLRGQPDLLAQFGARWKMRLVVGLVVSFVASIGAALRYGGGPWMIEHAIAVRWMASFATSLAMAASMFGWIGAFTQMFSRPSAAARYLADASYWMYLAHLPIVVGLQVALAGSGWPWWVQVPLINGVTAAVLLATYHVAVRRTWIGLWLNGRRYGSVRPPVPRT